ncbi:unnamed protein product [Mytilus coruscus]|uniref:Mitochondria-eating protein n=1 Tax=Mytilus coruscus TaxID=42192 RepID=A0A6J8DEE3_MYTCO|nr:unnamed protein product [Mytilus coruscus]
MSFIRISPHRRSTRKRLFEVSSPREESSTEFNYDDLKNAITDAENDLNVMRKKLKPTKKPGGRCNSFEAVKQHFVDTVHGHINSLNKGLGVKYQEVIKLEDDANQEKELHRREQSKLERKVKDLQSDLQKSDKTLQEKESEIESCKEKLQLESKARENELKKQQSELDARFSEQLQDKERIIEGQKLTITRLEEQIKTKDNDITSLKQGQEKSNAFQEKLQRKEKEILNMKNTNESEKQMIVEHYKEMIQNKEKEIHSLQQVNHQFKQYVEQKEEEMKRIQVDFQRKENTIQQLLKQREEEKAAKEDERKQKDEALTRLSAIAGDRLRNNNPGITDLSDPNRPMKIAEKFTEMYDNDWTDSMEALEDLGLNEEECVIMLLHFLTDSYEECGRLVSELDRHIEQAVTLTHCEQDGDKSDESSSSSQNIPPEILKPIKDIRRKMTVNNMEILQKKLLAHLKNVRTDVKDDHISACSKFVADCIKYAWMMQIQDPPVYIEWDFPSDAKIDTNILRSYTKAGDHVDFIVWPVLYLHKDGPVLNKGVVQPKSANK